MDNYETIQNDLMLDGQPYRSYGIRVRSSGMQICDITISDQLAVCLAEAFNRCELSPIHVWDAVEDWLAGSF